MFDFLSSLSHLDGGRMMGNYYVLVSSLKSWNSFLVSRRKLKISWIFNSNSEEFCVIFFWKMSIFSKSEAVAKKVISQIPSGGVIVNDLLLNFTSKLIVANVKMKTCPSEGSVALVLEHTTGNSVSKRFRKSAVFFGDLTVWNG